MFKEIWTYCQLWKFNLGRTNDNRKLFAIPTSNNIFMNILYPKMYFLKCYHIDLIMIISMIYNLYFKIYKLDMTKPECVVCKLTLSDLFVVNETISRFSKYLFTQVTILSIKTKKRIE